MCPGRQLQLSPQRLSLPQAPFPEAWLEARWHGCSALAACKWIAAPPAPVLTPSPGPQAPGTLPSRQSSLTPPSSWCQRHSANNSLAQVGRGLIWSRVGFVVWWALTPTCFLPPPPPDMRRDVQEIFRLTPHEKQCMMFSATLSKEIRPVCRKFMQDVSSGQDLSFGILWVQALGCSDSYAVFMTQECWEANRALLFSCQNGS